MRTAILTIGHKSDIQFLIELARKMGIKIFMLNLKETKAHPRSTPNELTEDISFSKFLG